MDCFAQIDTPITYKCTYVLTALHYQSNTVCNILYQPVPYTYCTYT